MDTQKRIIIWVSAVLIVVIAAIGAYQVANTEMPRRDGSLSTPLNEADWTKGASNPKVSFVEYSDFECPACGAYHPILEEMFTKYKDDISFTYRHFPLPQHPNALPAAYAAEAAGLQGKFWEMTNTLFNNQTEWAESENPNSIFENYAQSLNLDMIKYSNDIASDEVKNAVEDDRKSAILSAIDHTPTFFINGKMIENPNSIEELDTLIATTIANTLKETTQEASQ